MGSYRTLYDARVNEWTVANPDRDPATEYLAAVAAEDSKLDERLAEIRGQQDTRQLGAIEAAIETIAALEHHRHALQALRIGFFGVPS